MGGLTPDDSQDPPLEIPRDFHDAMVAHCQRESPLESCGILGGVSPRVSSIYPLHNELVSETRYYADPQDVIQAQIALREQRADILAIYHSHPRSHAEPSRIDLVENYYGPVPRIIVSLSGKTPEVRVWRLDADSFQELPWRIIEREDGTGP
jgi:[CysO sulfur-carrier protein]-S-L-cysteine hydrolase